MTFYISISAKNPPPLCAGVPHIKELSLCIRFYNLSTSNFSFSGCVDVEAHILHVIDEKYDLGCFKIGNKAKIAMMQHFEKIEFNPEMEEDEVADRLLFNQQKSEIPKNN